MRDDSLILNMQLAGHSSQFVLGPLAGLELARFVPAPPPVYIVDQTVRELHPRWLEQIQEGCDHCEHRTLALLGGEEVKTLQRLDEIYRWLAEIALPRDATLVAVGGGTICDLAGLAAATWRRGINFVAIPTTLLAMVDAAIGGKTAVNTAGLKNPVGCFHPAAGILADCGFLTTLTRQAWRDGMAELIKTAIIGDGPLFADLYGSRSRLYKLLGEGDPGDPIPGVLGALPWRDWIGRAARIKVKVVNEDFHEKGPRRALNLGHTVGHALEAWSHEIGEPLSHGEAVAIGMAVVFRIAAERGRCALPEAVQVIELLEACGLPVSHPAPELVELRRLLSGDKKQSVRSGLRWVLPERIGKVTTNATVAAEEVRKWLDPHGGS